MTTAYQKLTHSFTRLHRYQHLMSIAGWDQMTFMPPEGRAARAAAMGEMATLMHRTLTDLQMREWIAAAKSEALDALEQANLTEMERAWRNEAALPEDLVEARVLASSRCEHAWRTLRPANDWAGFLENFREVVTLSRRAARLLADASGVSPYDAMLDLHEPGMSSHQLDGIFSAVKTWLPGMIATVRERQSHSSPILPRGPFPVASQRALGVKLMERLGFDFSAGRVDVSLHPFCGGVPEDVRLTTRYREDDFTQSMMGIIHETGHARYEQNLPRDWLGQPLAQARSMGIHESQSLSFEMQIARNLDFMTELAPLLNEHFGQQEAFDPANLLQLTTRVRPGLIRVDADEMTYPAHIILRYEIERALIDGEIEPEDIPALWDEKMQAYLGLDTRGNFKDGCMQDIHWPEGIFGYFPSYALGAMYAAQFFTTIRRSAAGSDSFAQATDWLKQNIWIQGSRYTTDELVSRATGETLNPAHYRAHLQSRYLGG